MTYSKDTIGALALDYAVAHPERVAQRFRDNGGEGDYRPVEWREMIASVRGFSAGLLSLEVRQGHRIGIIADNRPEWLIINLGILSIGAVDVPRGCDTADDEITYILEHSESGIVVAENEQQATRILAAKKRLPKLRAIILIEDDISPALKKEAQRARVSLHTYAQVTRRGEEALRKSPNIVDEAAAKVGTDDLATIIYTSGSTGTPKGVMLTHANFMHQLYAPLVPLEIREGYTFLSVLPIWHAYERSLEYICLFAGASLAYSKPVPQVMIKDMEDVHPEIFPSVPRIWIAVRKAIYKKMDAEPAVRRAIFNFFVAVGSLFRRGVEWGFCLCPRFRRFTWIPLMLLGWVLLVPLTPLYGLGKLLVYRKLQARLGGRFQFGVSGAGALPPHVDRFFAAVGIKVLEGYGLTEAAPVVSVRASRRPISGTVGKPLPGIEIKAIDREGRPVKPGQKGVLLIRGANVMRGYYRQEKATAEAIDGDGWLNTGDLVLLTHDNDIRIIGRAKETIVLLNGENVEPSPIEEAIAASNFVDQVMVVGQDRMQLGALIVANVDAVAAHVGRPIPGDDDMSARLELLNLPAVRKLFRGEIDHHVSPSRGFRQIERIGPYALFAQPFKPVIEVTQTLKLRRAVITKRRHADINALY